MLKQCLQNMLHIGVSGMTLNGYTSSLATDIFGLLGPSNPFPFSPHFPQTRRKKEIGNSSLIHFPAFLATLPPNPWCTWACILPISVNIIKNVLKNTKILKHDLLRVSFLLLVCAALFASGWHLELFRDPGLSWLSGLTSSKCRGTHLCLLAWII